MYPRSLKEGVIKEFRKAESALLSSYSAVRSIVSIRLIKFGPAGRFYVNNSVCPWIQRVPSGKWLELSLARSPGSTKISFQAARSIG